MVMNLKTLFVKYIKLRNKLDNAKIYKIVDNTNQNVYIGGNSGETFDGHVARLQYFANSLNTQQAYNIYRDGIDSNLISDFFNKYKLKIQFLEYNTPVGKPLVL